MSQESEDIKVKLCMFTKFVATTLIRRCSKFVNKMADETRNPDRSNTDIYGPARDASQLIRARDFTGSIACVNK